VRLDRLADEPVEQVVYADPRESRPAEISDEQHDQFVGVLHESPKAVSYDAPVWSAPLARYYISEEFDVEYCERYVRRFISEAGLSSGQHGWNSTDLEREPKKSGKKDSKTPTIWTTTTPS